MKRRLRKIVNFFAFNLLFFALYLNFIHKDSITTTPVPVQANAAAYNGTVPVLDPAKYVDSKSSVTAQPAAETKSTEVSAKSTIN